MITVVTGSEGFLGRKVVARLASAGHSVVAVDRVGHSGPLVDGVTYHVSDLSDPSTLVPLLARRSPAGEDGSPCLPGEARTAKTGPLDTFVLVHLAWDMRRHLGHSVQDRQVELLEGLVTYWQSRGLGRVVAMGSAEEYGARSGNLREQDEPLPPLSPYGVAKRNAHDLLMQWGRQTGCAVIWLRPFIMYGPGQTGDMLIPYACACARSGRAAEFSDGHQTRDFVFIDDVVDALMAALEKLREGQHAFNLGRGEPVAVIDMLHEIARHYQAEELFDLGVRPRRPGEPDIQIADTAKARDVLGWHAKTSWVEGLARTLSSEEK